MLRQLSLSLITFSLGMFSAVPAAAEINDEGDMGDFSNAPVITAEETMTASSNNSTVSGTWIQGSDGRWWYRHSDGSYTSNGWEYINGKWYHFDQNGWMQTGWLYTGGNWYYLNSDGSMRTGWLHLNETWYFLSASGAMVTGHSRIHNTDYYFNSSGALIYDASLVAAIYSKNYGLLDINTIPSGNIEDEILNDYYVVERYDNFVRNDFLSTSNIISTNNMNRGIFIYNGHGYSNGSGISIGDGTGISPSEILGMSLNNVKVAMFFTCYGAKPDSSGHSLVSSAVDAGADAAFGFLYETYSRSNMVVASVILQDMMDGYTLQEAVDDARTLYPSVDSEHGFHYQIRGDRDIVINNTYEISDFNTLNVPDGYEIYAENGSFSAYQLVYKGYKTTDRYVYDSSRGCYRNIRNRITDDMLDGIDFEKVEHNIQRQFVSGYAEYSEMITEINGYATVVRVYMQNSGIDTPIIIDLQNGKDISGEVNFYEEIY